MKILIKKTTNTLKIFLYNNVTKIFYCKCASNKYFKSAKNFIILKKRNPKYFPVTGNKSSSRPGINKSRNVSHEKQIKKSSVSTMINTVLPDGSFWNQIGSFWRAVVPKIWAWFLVPFWFLFVSENILNIYVVKLLNIP